MTFTKFGVMVLASLLMLVPRTPQELKVVSVSPAAVSEKAIKEKPKAKKKKKKKATKEKELFKITAYCPCKECSGGYGNHTATGTIARANYTIAVDPSVIKYGTKIKIDGITYTAEDCGGGVKGKHIDIYFNNHKEVERYGVKYKKVRLRNG